MAWIFNLRSQGCTGTFQKYFEEDKFVDALAHLRDEKRNLWIYDANLMGWQEVQKLTKDERKKIGI